MFKYYIVSESFRKTAKNFNISRTKLTSLLKKYNLLEIAKNIVKCKYINHEGSNICRKCNDGKPGGEFKKHSNICRDCENLSKKLWNQNNSKYIREYNKKYKKSNSKVISEYKRIYRKNNIEKERTSKKQNT